MRKGSVTSWALAGHKLDTSWTRAEHELGTSWPQGGHELGRNAPELDTGWAQARLKWNISRTQIAHEFGHELVKTWARAEHELGTSWPRDGHELGSEGVPEAPRSSPRGRHQLEFRILVEIEPQRPQRPPQRPPPSDHYKTRVKRPSAAVLCTRVRELSVLH